MKRRSFINKLGLVTALAGSLDLDSCDTLPKSSFFIATWNNREAVKTAASKYLETNNLLDSLEAGINTVENNPDDQSVGYGGRPDRDGNVTLDACIMDSFGNAGSVTFLQNFKNPVSIARDVMEKTPHVILSGKGAELFATQQGYKSENLLTEKSKKAYQEWLKEANYKPIINIENHDTIGMLGFSETGNLAGACSTSGLAFKMAGRVGDSPIIGAGLFVDNDYGSCVATGLGEKVLTSLASFLVVELMRNNYSPEDACKEALNRIIKKEPNKPDFQVALIAIDKKGNHGGYALYSGFNYAFCGAHEVKLFETKFFYNA